MNDALARLREVDTFILDLDGTVYLSNELLPGAKEFLQYLSGAGKRYVFITNNSSRTAPEYVTKLARLGIEASLDNVYTSLDSTLAWLGTQEGGRVYPVGVDSLVEAVRAAGYEVTAESPDWVLLGFDTTITYEKIRKAARALLGGARFVATHPDLTCPTAEGPIPDTGAFIRLFEAATGATPVICGKPFPAMVKGALAKLGGSPEKAAIIGDRLYTDIAMGRASGVLAILVLSGETRAEDIAGAPGEHQPELVFENLAAVLAALRGRE